MKAIKSVVDVWWLQIKILCSFYRTSRRIYAYACTGLPRAQSSNIMRWYSERSDVCLNVANGWLQDLWSLFFNILCLSSSVRTRFCLYLLNCGRTFSIYVIDEEPSKRLLFKVVIMTVLMVGRICLLSPPPLSLFLSSASGMWIGDCGVIQAWQFFHFMLSDLQVIVLV